MSDPYKYLYLSSTKKKKKKKCLKKKKLGYVIMPLYLSFL